MAVPASKASFLKNTTGGSFVAAKQGGTILGNTTTSVDRISKALPLKDNATVFKDGTLPKAKNNGLVGNRKALTSGTFAYKQSDFIVRGMATRINGTANTSLRIVGNEQNRVRRNISSKSLGAKTSTAWRSGYFRMLGISGQRSNWSTPPATNIATYSDGVGGSASDTALYVTYKSVPGELVYMYGTIDPKQDDYKSQAG